MIVDGTVSNPFEISNIVFQGTVLGPPLWNLFFADVVVPAGSKGGDAAVFADDLNVFQLFDTEVPNDELFQHMSECREATHKWGKMNRVTFDAAKEHFIIIHPIFASGDPFRMLGCLVDCKFQMLQAIDNILTQVRPKM